MVDFLGFCYLDESSRRKTNTEGMIIYDIFQISIMTLSELLYLLNLARIYAVYH